METIKNLQAISCFNNSNNMQFFIYKNYIISISKGKNKVDLFDNKTFRRKFYLKRKRHEKNFDHEQWKLIYTKEHKLFLIGYEHEYETELFENKNENKKLDIYLLKIGQKKCVKKDSFNYYKFKEDEKEDKLYIIKDNKMIIYDLNIGIYNIKFCEFKNGMSNLYWMNLFITSDYIVYIYYNMIIRWVFSFFYEIKDKNLDSDKECFYMDPTGLYDDTNDNYKYARNHFVQISDNLFTIGSEIHNHSRIIYFAEIKAKENFEPLEEDESIYFNENEITIINETDDLNIYPINKEKCGIVCGYKNYYLCNLIKMEINLKIELNIKEKFFLLKLIDDDNKYKIYLTDETNKKLLYISS
jgi:hypothetical protein